ncbi:MAG: hypothetical protein ACI9KS_000161 [Sulfitobacter sp.]|jgi:hypothetical protein
MYERPIRHRKPPREGNNIIPRLTLILIAVLSASPVLADPPVIESATLTGNRLSVSLSHPDTGWAHYADGWSVFAPNRTEIGTRVLAHPHVEEQPFTRSLSLSNLPKGLTHLVITATCNEGDTSAPFHLTLTN